MSTESKFTWFELSERASAKYRMQSQQFGTPIYPKDAVEVQGPKDQFQVRDLIIELAMHRSVSNPNYPQEKVREITALASPKLSLDFGFNLV